MDNPYPCEETTAKPTVRIHHSSENPKYAGTRVIQVEVPSSITSEVGISVDVHAYIYGRGETTLVVDLVSSKAGSLRGVMLEAVTVSPPPEIYVTPTVTRSGTYIYPPTGVVSTVDTSRVILHARTRASVPCADPNERPGLALVNASKIVRPSGRDFYAIVHYFGKIEKFWLTIATSCMPTNDNAGSSLVAQCGRDP